MYVRLHLLAFLKIANLMSQMMSMLLCEHASSREQVIV